MKTTSAQIKYFKKGGFYSVENENVKHTKILPYLSIVQSVEGSYDITIGNGPTYQTGEGGFFIAPSNVHQTIVHRVNTKSKKMTCRWVFIYVEVNKAFPLDSLYQFPIIIKDEHKIELNRIFDRLFETDSIWRNYSDCYALIDCILKFAKPIPNETNKGILRAIEYITENYRKQITVEDLANVANMSESNFYTVFKKHKAISPIAFLNNYRLSVAADKLAETASAVNEISCAVGINDPLYFSRLFKKTYGMTPKEYRAAYQSKQ